MDQDIEENAQGPAVHLPEGETSLEGGQQDQAALAPTLDGQNSLTKASAVAPGMAASMGEDTAWGSSSHLHPTTSTPLRLPHTGPRS